jgi:hypothetical protein
VLPSLVLEVMLKPVGGVDVTVSAADWAALSRTKTPSDKNERQRTVISDRRIFLSLPA